MKDRSCSDVVWTLVPPFFSLSLAMEEVLIRYSEGTDDICESFENNHDLC